MGFPGRVVKEVRLPSTCLPIDVLRMGRGDEWTCDMAELSFHRMIAELEDAKYFDTDRLGFGTLSISGIRFGVIYDAEGTGKKWEGYAGIIVGDVPVYGPAFVYGLSEDGRPRGLTEFEKDLLWGSVTLDRFISDGVPATAWRLHMSP